MDIVGFTNMSRMVSPEQVMQVLNELFSIFDDLAKLHGVQKVETAGGIDPTQGQSSPSWHPYPAI